MGLIKEAAVSSMLGWCEPVVVAFAPREAYTDSIPSLGSSAKSALYRKNNKEARRRQESPLRLLHNSTAI